MSPQDLVNHYNFYGYHEGLVSTTIKSRYDFIDLIPKDESVILEIGPLCNPCMVGKRKNVYTVDYFTKEELIHNYMNDTNVDKSKICDVNYVIKDNLKYSDVITDKRFDICFSSHNIEHVPCLISFLNNISSILKPSSYFFLCIPDYRYCFDHFRKPSTIFDVLDSYYNKQNKPSPISHLESIYINTHNDSVKHWETLDNSIRNIFVSMNEEKSFVLQARDKIIKEIEYVKKAYTECNEIYIDSHCWKFNSFIFRSIIEILFTTKFIDLKVVRVYKTLKGSNEFYAILQKE
jgi:predicted SAM-dependent methyltransferase